MNRDRVHWVRRRAHTSSPAVTWIGDGRACGRSAPTGHGVYPHIRGGSLVRGMG